MRLFPSEKGDKAWDRNVGLGYPFILNISLNLLLSLMLVISFQVMQNNFDVLLGIFYISIVNKSQ